MKFVKMFLASFVVLALSAAFATKSLAQTSVTGEIVYTASPNFHISDGSLSDLSNTSNWGNIQTLGTKSDCSGSSYICKITFSYTLPADTDPVTKAELVAGIASLYDVTTTPHHFTGNQFTVRGITVTITIVEKANN